MNSSINKLKHRGKPTLTAERAVYQHDITSASPAEGTKSARDKPTVLNNT